MEKDVTCKFYENPSDLYKSRTEYIKKKIEKDRIHKPINTVSEIFYHSDIYFK